MSVSFQTLFERSRYSICSRRFGLHEPAGQERIDQQERFATGMMGFALSHDQQFRSHFLSQVCNLGEQALGLGWDVSVEPFNWADLLLQHQLSRTLVVAELKIGAPLERHQNPSEVEFDSVRNGTCAGYGWEISRAAERHGWKKLVYVTIERKASWTRAATKSSGLRCISAEWSLLSRENASSLEEDLYDCLAHFGVTTFISRTMKNKRLAEQATEPMALLIAVLKEVSGVDFRPNTQRLLSEAITFKFLGINLRREDFPKIAELVGAEKDIIGWFGYERTERGSGLGVWFYCDDRDRAQTGLVGERIKKCLLGAGIDTSAFEEIDAYLHVFCKAEESCGDLEWFSKVLRAANK
jgi:hypothetical protein